MCCTLSLAEVGVQKVPATTPRSLGFFQILNVGLAISPFLRLSLLPEGVSYSFLSELQAIILAFPLEQFFLPPDHSHLTTWASGLCSNTLSFFFFFCFGSSASAFYLLAWQAGATLTDSLILPEYNNFVLTCLSIIFPLVVSLTKLHAPWGEERWQWSCLSRTQ